MLPLQNCNLNVRAKRSLAWVWSSKERKTVHWKKNPGGQKGKLIESNKQHWIRKSKHRNLQELCSVPGASHLTKIVVPRSSGCTFLNKLGKYLLEMFFTLMQLASALWRQVEQSQRRGCLRQVGMIHTTMWDSDTTGPGPQDVIIRLSALLDGWIQ